MDELNYHIPPDILHYESKYLMGFSINDLLIAMMVAMPLMMVASPIVGLLGGAGALVFLRRFDGLGNRSVIMYLGAMIWYRFRPEDVQAPRTLPASAARVEVLSWAGEHRFTLQDGK